ncbi:MAG: hypothetical protein P1U88_05995 [Thalassobaculaceae bacterium]|nr:hypothetical protein [Thalassobaculaceae bacterium]
MLVDFASGSAGLSRSDGLDLVTSALGDLVQAASRAEGAFAQLVGQMAAPIQPSGAAVPGSSIADDVIGQFGDAQGRLIDGIVLGNEIAADGSIAVWSQFGDRMASLFDDLFQQIAQDGEVSFASLFRALVPIVSDLFAHTAGSLGGVAGAGGTGFDISGIVNGIGGLLGGGTAGTGSGQGMGGFGGLFGGGGSTAGSLISAGTSIIGAVAGGGGALGGIFGSGLGAFAAINPYLAAALAIAQIVGPMLFAPSPSVGPTTVARAFPATEDAIYSTDNGGDPGALVDTVETIFDEIDRFQSRFGGRLNGNGFDIGYFPDPEDGSGQTGGYNFKAIIDGHAEDDDRFKGLSEAELITEAVKFIVQEGLEGIDVPEVAEAAKHSVAESLEELFDDLIFAERFGALRDALADAGDGIDAYTVTLQRQRLEIEETGLALATDGVTAIRDFLDRVMTLFPGDPYLPESSNAAEIDITAFGSPTGDEETRLLYEQDEGSGRFQPGVSGVYDEREGGLIGLSVAGETLTFAGEQRYDEGRPVESVPLGADEIELIGGSATISNEALQALVGTAADLGTAVDQTVEYSQEYLDNQERVRDAFAVAKADVDALVEVIAGGFEPEVIGPFEQRLIAGAAAIDQLESELERINEDIAAATEVFPDLGVAAIAVAEKVQTATDLLTQQLQTDYSDEVARELRAETGLGVQDDLADLTQEYQDRRADGEAIGIADFSDLEELYRARIVSLLDGTDDLAGVLDQVEGSFADLVGVADLLPGVLAELEQTYSAELERDSRAASRLGIIDEIADRISDYEDRLSVGSALGLEDLSGLDTVLQDQLADVLAPATLTSDAIDALRTTFADNALVMEALAAALDLGVEAANDNAAAQFSVADATRLATEELNRQIEEQERLAGVAERVIDSIADTRRRIALDPNLSTLSPAQQLDEARSYFETLAERAAGGDQDAQLEFGGAAQDYLQLARSFYASNEDYARIFSDVDRALGDTQSVAEQQLDVARAQLEELRAISRSFSGELAGLPNPDANFGQAPTRNRIIARLTGYAGDFGGGGFSAFRPGLSDDLNRAVDLLVQTIPFAAGGIMTAQGPLALHRYGQGGVADHPQLALFGEGRQPEAFVPLPDGRSIPVSIMEPANDRASGGDDGEGLADLIEETRRMTAAVIAMRADNASLRRGLERVVAASRGPGRAA